MKIEEKKQLRDESTEASSFPSDDLNFDLWAKEVRIQLVAAIQRRSKRSTEQ